MSIRLLNMRPYTLAAIIALTLGMSPEQPGAGKQRWDDGITTYALSPPVAGYFVPPTIFRDSNAVPLERILAVSQKMTEAQLAAYVQGGPMKITQAFLLFAFHNQSRPIFFWKGKHEGQQQILLRAWNGQIWDSSGYSDGRVDVDSYAFTPNPEQKLCYVMVAQQSGIEGHDQIQTERIGLGTLPSLWHYYHHGLATADTVVYLDNGLERASDEFMDCLKGNIQKAELQALFPKYESGYGQFVFLSGTGKERRIRFRADAARFYNNAGTLVGDYGKVTVPLAQDKNQPEFPLSVIQSVGSMRWALAREAAGPAQKDAECCLRESTPQGRPDGWRIFELTSGLQDPGNLFRPPVTRSQQDGGEALSGFVLQSGHTTATLSPQGRFGQVSAQAAEPEKNAALGVQYRFIGCGPGVVKLAVRPERGRWKGTVQAYCEIGPRFQQGKRYLSITLPLEFR